MKTKSARLLVLALASANALRATGADNATLRTGVPDNPRPPDPFSYQPLNPALGRVEFGREQS